jgi:ferritin
MGLSKEMGASIDAQIGREMESANIYLAMAIEFEGMGLGGFADFMYKQAREEEEHAMKFIKYSLEAGAKPEVQALPKPNSDYKSGIAMIEAALNHEKFITKNIHDLVRQARKEGDLATENFLQWYVSEQVEEEATFDGILKMCEMAGEDKLFMVQGQLKRD